MTDQERIAALREALGRIVAECAMHSTTAPSIARRALASDDAATAAPVPTVAVRTEFTTPPALRHRLDEVAAASPKPDLPLAEGSRWDAGQAVISSSGTELVLLPAGALAICAPGRPVAFVSLLDVLALARRGGYV